MSMLSKIKALTTSQTFRQTLAVSGSNIFVMGLGFAINILLAREMGVEAFGIFSFAFAVFSFAALFMEFGFYSTAAKVLADTNDIIAERKLLGGIFFTYIAINTIFAIFMYAVGLYIDNFFADKIGYIVRMLAFSGYAYTSPFFMEWVLKGCNKIYLLSQYNILGKFIYFLIIILLWLNQRLVPENVLMAYAGAYAAVVIYCHFKLKPLYTDLRQVIGYIYSSNKIYGCPQYLGRIVDVGSANIDRLLISYFVDAKSVGLYSLAVSFVSVVGVLGRCVGISKFKGFANEKCINDFVLNSVKYGTIVLASIVMIATYISVYFILGSDYLDTLLYASLLIFGAMAQSIYRIYIDWISGHGYSYELRNAAFSISFVNVICVLLLTYWGGILWTCIAASIGYIYSLYKYIKIYKYCVSV